ncbi:hypothetical protein B5C34_11010 [Pacificimonas flava]|uniref:N-formylglutamate amidohydrolase n=2 Tax=Pacificimonas TaxID=1960290 RepID=A0A219B863_9SPHN|nr:MULTISPECIES: N-formylglutamate amidohydrolase [Pacificimonas]MBZ6378801.1 N-formylglutamate amidohydrolase [Pacificimonas aurantium]OWV33938.1 hypothetical protein B5C34_11010 [Pacificimonas flava]
MTAPAFTVAECRGPVPPLVLASPHSGRIYPPDFLNRITCSERDLRQAEDAWVDRLVEPAAQELDLPLLKARYGRTVLDPNRAPDDLDPALIDMDAKGPGNVRTRAGLGVIPRVARPGVPLYSGKLTRAEADMRLDAIHRPYHDQLRTMLKRAYDANGFAILVDCHSMPPLPTSGGRPASQIVLGTGHGKSCAPGIARALEATLSAYYRVGIDEVYAGGWTTLHYGKPARGYHAVQLEVERTLYMDAGSLLPTDSFGDVSRRLSEAIGALYRAYPGISRLPQAAE